MTEIYAPAPRPRVDGRSSAARRYRALVKAFSRDLGDDLSAADTALIQSAALAALRIERLRAAMLSGEGDVDDESLTRLLNSTTRILSIVAGKSRKQSKRKMSLDEYLKDNAA
jgi:hypothetical protein